MDMSRSSKQEKTTARTQVRVSIDSKLPVQVELEARQLGLTDANIYERALRNYFATDGAVSTTTYEKKSIAKKLLTGRCGQLETAMGDVSDIPLMRYFRYFFINCNHFPDGSTNKSSLDIDKDKESSVFSLLFDLKSVDIELYNIILNEMGNYGRLRDRYIIIVGE